MERHIRHVGRYRNVGEFQAKINDAGHIPTGGRDLASIRQLAAASSWACKQIREHCRARGESVPLWAGESDHD